MTVSSFTQPDNTTQTGSAYKTAIDGAAHVHHRIAGAFACHQQDGNSPDAPDMTVVVDAGALVRAGLVPLEVAQQSTSALTAPSGNPRYDIVYIDNSTGAVGVATGAEAASPSDPAVPAGKTAVARVRFTVGMTEITNADIDDLRVGGGTPEMTGPDVSGSPQLPGTAGIVSAPQPGDETKFWRGDATWAIPADQVARDMAASAMAVADANGVAGPVGAFYLADPFTSDTLAVKTNAYYDGSNDWYSSASVETSDPTLANNGTGETNNAFRVIIAAAEFAANGSKIKVKFASSSSAALVVTQAYIGLGAAAGNAWDFASAPTELTFNGGSSGFSIGTSQTIESDEISFSYDETKKLVIAFDMGATGGGFAYAGAKTNYVTYRKTSAAEANQVAPSGYSSTAYACGAVDLVTITNIADMTLRPTPAALLLADPLDVMFYVLIDPVDAITMGTDLIGKISIADGSPEDFVTGTWTQVGTYGNFELWRLDVDLTGKAGSTLEYSIETINNKEIRFKQSVGCVPLY